jgi:hypothetical protein
MTSNYRSFLCWTFNGMNCLPYYRQYYTCRPATSKHIFIFTKAKKRHPSYTFHRLSFYDCNLSVASDDISFFPQRRLIDRHLHFNVWFTDKNVPLPRKAGGCAICNRKFFKVSDCEVHLETVFKRIVVLSNLLFLKRIQEDLTLIPYYSHSSFIQEDGSSTTITTIQWWTWPWY